MAEKELYSDILRLYILHKISRGPIFGLVIINDLVKHSYRLSLSTLYPILQTFERKGYVRSIETSGGRQRRRLYQITLAGQKALEAAKIKMGELFGEIFEDETEDDKC